MKYQFTYKLCKRLHWINYKQWFTFFQPTNKQKKTGQGSREREKCRIVCEYFDQKWMEKTHSHSHTHTLSLSLSLSHTHSHTHTCTRNKRDRKQVGRRITFFNESYHALTSLSLANIHVPSSLPLPLSTPLSISLSRLPIWFHTHLLFIAKTRTDFFFCIMNSSQIKNVSPPTEH